MQQPHKQPIPHGQRILEWRWCRYVHKKHIQRLSQIRGMVDQTPPVCPRHLSQRMKQEQIKEGTALFSPCADRYTEIERSNRILLERVTRIMAQPQRTATPTFSRKGSLNGNYRREFLRKIACENRVLSPL